MKVPEELLNDNRVATFVATAVRYPNVFATSREILRDYGSQPFECIGAEDGENWEHREFLRILNGLTNFSPVGPIAFFFAVFSLAQSNFAVRDCLIPCHEDGLTALLKRRVEDAVWWLEDSKNSAEQNQQIPGIFAADLNVRGRELRTGGDIAFLLGMNDAAGNPGYIVYCFQAKRANAAAVDIRRGYDRRDENDGGNQLRRLARLARIGCHCSYLFYNNDFKRVIAQPASPIVKDIRHILAHGEDALDVDLTNDCCDLASYILRSSSQDAEQLSYLTEVSLRAAIEALVQEEITHIVALGTSQTAFENILDISEDAGLVQPHHTPELDTSSIDFNLVAATAAVNWELEIEDPDTVSEIVFNGGRI